MAHELRTPLATLIGETELALAGKQTTAQFRNTLESNLEELQRMTAIVNDMLFLSRTGRDVRVRSEFIFSLNGLVKEVLEYHEAEALEADVLLRVEGDRAAHVDRSLFQRAVSNLISNAIRYSTPKGEILVAIVVDEREVRITVHNAGEPIEDHHLPRLFQRFYRLDSARTWESNHHGLGLAIVAEIARIHGGTPFAHSDSSGTSIGFTISLWPHGT